jgi:L-ascorbate metabolism protein UlaG (beta-lactamase superfamily)
MGPNDAVEAVKLLKPKKVVCSHYDTWPPIAQDPQQWAEKVRSQTKAEPVVLKPGESIRL